MAIRRWNPSALEDLSKIITRTTATSDSVHHRWANDRKTRDMLDASMRLLEQQFAAAPKQKKFGTRVKQVPFFQWLSAPKVAAEIFADPNRTVGEDADKTTTAVGRTFRTRWKPYENYILDFLSYAISVKHWSLHVALSEDVKGVLLGGLRKGDFPTAVHEVAFEDIAIPIKEPDTQRMQLMAAILAERQPELGQILMDVYTRVDESWTDLYRSVFEEKGWKLRPNLEYQHINLMLSTAAEGMALRGMIDPAGIIDFQNRKSLLGTLALALMIACVDSGDGQSLEDLTRTLLPPE